MDPSAFLHELLDSTPSSLHPLIQACIASSQKKLHHQLTQHLTELMHHADAAPYLLSIYTKFISKFESKIDSLRLVDMCVVTARQFAGMFP
jgi:26S proteasome regulatory subunit N9